MGITVSTSLLLPLLLALLLPGALVRPAAPVRRFAARLSGAEEVPPVITRASGSARFEVNEPETQIAFELSVQDIRNVTAAHIHLGARGINGPIVAFLFGPVPGGVTRDGLLSRGILTDRALTGPLRGAGIGRLVAEMRRGNTYVNVHTLAHPDGEIRGQIGPSLARP